MEHYSGLIPNQIIHGERLYEEAINIILATAQNELLIFDQDLSHGDFASLQKFDFFQQFLSENINSRLTVSYTHLDVYKRQLTCGAMLTINCLPLY